MTKISRRALVIASIIVVAAASAGIVAVNHQSQPWGNYVDQKRAHGVLVNAFSVANPGYSVDHFAIEESNFNIQPSGGTVVVPVSARSPVLKNLYQWNRFLVG